MSTEGKSSREAALSLVYNILVLSTLPLHWLVADAGAAGCLSGLAHINFHERDRGNVLPGTRTLPWTATFSKLVAAEIRNQDNSRLAQCRYMNLHSEVKYLFEL